MSESRSFRPYDRAPLENDYSRIDLGRLRGSHVHLVRDRVPSPSDAKRYPTNPPAGLVRMSTYNQPHSGSRAPANQYDYDIEIMPPPPRRREGARRSVSVVDPEAEARHQKEKDQLQEENDILREKVKKLTARVKKAEDRDVDHRHEKELNETAELKYMQGFIDGYQYASGEALPSPVIAKFAAQGMFIPAPAQPVGPTAPPFQQRLVAVGGAPTMTTTTATAAVPLTTWRSTSTQTGPLRFKKGTQTSPLVHTHATQTPVVKGSTRSGRSAGASNPVSGAASSARHGRGISGNRNEDLEPAQRLADSPPLREPATRNRHVSSWSSPDSDDDLHDTDYTDTNVTTEARPSRQTARVVVLEEHSDADLESSRHPDIPRWGSGATEGLSRNNSP